MGNTPINPNNPQRLHLNAFHLKCIAMFAMTLDHVAWRFLAYDTLSSELFHFIGRLVAPLMCYFLAKGFYHSKNHTAYALRLLIFAMLSQAPYALFNTPIAMLTNLGLHHNIWQIVLYFDKGNVLFSLFFALLALQIVHSSWHFLAKIAGILALYPIISLCDYGFAMIFMALFFDYFYHEKQLLIKNKTALHAKIFQELGAYILATPVIYWLIYGFRQTVGLGFMHFGMILTAPLIYADNGQKGSGFGGRYLFYLFYPLHMLVIVAVDVLLHLG